MRNIVQIIRNKRDGKTLTRDDIKFFIHGCTTGKIPSYQIAALLMTIYYQGMTFDETAHLMRAMMLSGSTMDLSGIRAPKIDKHSTGGVGDKVSLILAPLVASCGVCVPMISGRGLGHTGGTLDKLESIPGFNTQLSSKRITKQLQRIGVVMIGQTREIAPADKLLYALRDVTATVDSIPLIAASIMSKKLAEDLNGLVLDVKYGTGAFMRDHGAAKELAWTMVQIGKRARVKVTAMLTDMNNPLGTYVGNALEAMEAIEALKGNGSQDLMDITYALGAEMLALARIKGGRTLLVNKITSGAALDVFKKIICAQDGDALVCEDYSRLPIAKNKASVRSHASGFVHSIDTYRIGMLLVQLGGGRMKEDDTIDPSCGFRVFKKIGDRIKTGEALVEIYSDNRIAREAVKKKMKEVFAVKSQPFRKKKLIREILS
ncbi:thymidine phosphorylase [candidate division WOR-3 bacterium]|nr:thymidine phosphorylase [candidate division WOR-3 bacterium]